MPHEKTQNQATKFTESALAATVKPHRWRRNSPSLSAQPLKKPCTAIWVDKKAPRCTRGTESERENNREGPTGDGGELLHAPVWVNRVKRVQLASEARTARRREERRRERERERESVPPPKSFLVFGCENVSVSVCAVCEVWGTTFMRRADSIGYLLTWRLAWKKERGCKRDIGVYSRVRVCCEGWLGKRFDKNYYLGGKATREIEKTEIILQHGTIIFS